MGRGFDQAEVFPVIARLISAHHPGRTDFVTHTDLVRALQRDEQGCKLIQFAVEQDEKQRASEWWASNMIQWFSQKYTEGIGAYVRMFERREEKDGWAYRPCMRNEGQNANGASDSSNTISG